MDTTLARFCTRCGSALIDTPAGQRCCPTCLSTRSADARILVGCCVMQGDRLLWIRRGNVPRRGFWHVPSGFLECGETPAQAAARELFEEVGLQVPHESLRLLGLGSVAHMNEIYVMHRTSVAEVSLALGPEALEARFCTESEAPWDQVAFPNVSYLARLTYANMRRGRHGVYLVRYEAETYIDQS